LPAPALRDLLVQLTAADRAGASAEAAALRGQVFEQLAELRANQVRSGTTPAAPAALDFLLFGSMGRDLEHARMPREAADLYRAALAHAARHQHMYWHTFFSLRLVHLAIDSRDASTAEEKLRHAMEPPWRPAWRGSGPWFERAYDESRRPLTAPDAKPPLADLRAQRLVALARHLAHVGRLPAAARAYREALAVLAVRDDPFVSREGIYLALAEVLLDLGDGEAFHALASAHRASEPGPSRSWTWLESTWALATGRFSMVVKRCNELRADSATPGQLARDALAREVEALIALNRLADAEALIPPGDERLSRLLAARGAWQDQLPPSIKEMLPDESADSAVDATGAARIEGSAAIDATLPDGIARCERIAQAWALRSQSLLLRAHDAPGPERLDELDALMAWSTTIESPLIEAERELVAAIIKISCGGDARESAAHASQAEARFGALDMPHRARDACHVQAQIAGDERRANSSRREAALIETMRARLDSADWSTYRLNKWDMVDWEIIDRTARVGAEASGATARALWMEIDRLRSTGEPEQMASRVCAHPGWLPRRTAVAQYVALPDRLLLFIADRRSCRYRVVWTARGELWRATTTLVNVVQTADPQHFRARALAEAQRTLARRLGLELLVSCLPESIDRLLIVPDDILAHVPFAALAIDGRRLVDRVAISLLPDPVWTRGPDADERGRPDRALAVAIRESQAPDLTERALPLARQEADTLALAEPKHLLPLTDPSRSDVVRELPAVAVAHFACHGEFRDHAPTRSGLALRDEWLTVADVEELPLARLRLAMIASCWTGNARILPGSALIGLPLAFLRAGARAAISALWQVPQDAGVEIARAYYARLSRAGAARALAEALREVSGTSAPAGARPPFDWAGLLCYQRAVRPRWLGRARLAWIDLVRFVGRLLRDQSSRSSARC
jgi:hypothetical protein